MNPKKINQLEIYRQQNMVGKIERIDHGSKFTFSDSFLANDKYLFLSYNIQKSQTPQVFNGAGLPPFFAGLLPEGWRFKASIKKLKTSEDDLFSLFAVTGRSCIGDVWVKTQFKQPQLKEYREVNFYEIFNHFTEGTSNFDEAIAGVQEKISASMLSLPISKKDDASAFILKLNPKDKPSLIYNEFYTLRLAQAVGIQTNKAKIVFDKDQNPGLLISRFDRLPNKNKMLHQEDMCQLMNLYPADKYRVSMQQIFDVIKKISPSWPIELLKVIELYVFSYLVGNGDLHAKNISMIWDDDLSPRTLTPAYDLISTTVYGDHKMALKIDGRDSNFDRSQIIKFCVRNGLPAKAVERSVDRILKRFVKHKGYFDKIGHDDRSRKWLLASFEKKARRFK